MTSYVQKIKLCLFNFEKIICKISIKAKAPASLILDCAPRLQDDHWVTWNGVIMSYVPTPIKK